jgi:ElaB/YqjD/DUF883 family membrane-anchored ribosome-binding protein
VRSIAEEFEVFFFPTITKERSFMTDTQKTYPGAGTYSGASQPNRGFSDRPAAVPAHSSSSDESATMSISSTEWSKLQEEMTSLKETVMKFISAAGEDAAKTAHDVGQSVASQVSTAASGAVEAGANMASSAADQAKTFASDLESMARKNPLGAMAGALVVGVLVGLIGRGRG